MMKPKEDRTAKKPKSIVNELMTHDEDPKGCGQGFSIQKKPTRPTIAVVTDEVRRLIIPDRNPIRKFGIWPKSDFKRLQKQAEVITLEQKKDMIERMEKKKQDDLVASNMRKEALERAQIKGTYKRHKADDQQLITQSELLLTRSSDMRNEQEDRVKVANSIILATKCRAIRNAQIVEKNLIQKQFEEESKRLDDMMEQTRQKALKMEREIEQAGEYSKKRYSIELKQQIKENEIEKLLEKERKEEESRMLNRAQMELMEQEEKKNKQDKEMKKKIREDLHQAALDHERYKLLLQEEQKIADLRIKEYMKKKAEREEKLEAEAEVIRHAKEREIARLAAQQQKNMDQRALLDEMKALVVQEDVERVWREQEKKIALKKIKDMEELSRARKQQILDIKAKKALALERDEIAHLKVAQIQQELFDKDKNSQATRKERNLKHRKELLRDINEREHKRINEIKDKFEEGRGFRLEEEKRDREISKYIQIKVQKLRNEALPEVYVKDIERQLKIHR